MTNTIDRAELIIRLLKRVYAELVLRPSVLEIRPRLTTTKAGSLLRINTKTNVGDTARIVGKKGQHFRAIQKLFSEMALKNEITVNLEWLTPPTDQTNEKYPERQAGHVWPWQRVKELAQDIAEMIFKHDYLVRVEMADDADLTFMAVFVAETEEKQAEEVRESMKHLFESIGKIHGRKLDFKLFPKEKPATAAGRYCGVVTK